MDCSGLLFRGVTATVSVVLIAAASGCIAPLLATGIYVAQGGNVVPAEFEGLNGKRVVVLCRPPASSDFRHASAPRSIARRVSQHISRNVKGVKVVDQKEVDNWIDTSGGEDFKDLGRAVNADMLVYIELDDFNLFKGRTLYQGTSAVTVSVYDMASDSDPIWEASLGEVLYPHNSGIPASDKPVQQFQREFESVIAETIAVKFYKHDPHKLFAMDALANR
jgi:hypothetical protein